VGSIFLEGEGSALCFFQEIVNAQRQLFVLGLFFIAMLRLRNAVSRHARQKNPLLRAFLLCRGGGIRTPDPREGMPVFKTGAINRSATPLGFG
jgi:hypothetical protein